jgi:lipid A ethanolaminephosphotransferase
VRASGVAERRPLLVVLVVGETARAANFSLGGYERETNPLLAAQPILYFPNVTSCGTNTAVSVPCMFSPFGQKRYSDTKAKSHESLLDVVQRTGVSVLWRDNNSGCKSTCDRVPRHGGNELRREAFCDGDGCFDEVLLEGLPRWIDGLQGDGLVVLHQQGSHGPAYYKRSPAAFKKFLPECADAAVEACSRQEIVNAYDNTILYTDFVLSRLIGLLEPAAGRFDVAMLYVSDHGESLGEGGLYLHGLPWLFAPSEQTHVPMLVWLSDGFSADRGIDRACLEQRRHESHSHDDLFHSVLGLFDVATRIYQPELDLFRPCRAPEPKMLSER